MRLREFTSKAEMERYIDTYITAGYEAQQKADVIFLKKRNWLRTKDEMLLRLNDGTNTFQLKNYSVKKCRYCGTTQSNTARYCNTCGKYLLRFIDGIDAEVVIIASVICLLFALTFFHL